MNPYLRKMGYRASDKVLITHIDDMGFCHSANVACFQNLANRAASSASVITSAPWFNHAAAWCRLNPQYDIGVHLSLTCEHDSYRWPPLTAAAALRDSQGYQWATAQAAVAAIPADVAKAEMRAQIEQALQAGITLSHIDTHMGTVLDAKYLRAYVDLADEYVLVAFLPKIEFAALAQLRGEVFAKDYLQALAQLNLTGRPTLDHIIIDTLKPVADKLAYYQNLIQQLKPGLTHLLFHSALMSDELLSITPGSAQARHQDYLAFSGDGVTQQLASSDIKLISYADLQRYL